MKNTLNSICLLIILVIITYKGWNIADLFNPPTPINVDRYTVVIIEETESRQNLPQEQLNAINSQVWKDYIDSQGGQWRVLDPHTDVSKDKEWVKKALGAPRESLPWLIFASPTRGYSGPLPQNLEELLEVIQQ